MNQDVTLVRELGDDAFDQIMRVKTIVGHLATHQFGNYVLQKVIQIEMEWSLKKQVLEEIKLQAEDLMNTKHGPKVLQKLKSTYPRIFGGASTSVNTQANDKQKYQVPNKNRSG